MSTTLDSDAAMRLAKPITDQHAHEIQPYGHLIRLPIGLDANACAESVQNLNQVLADTIVLRDMYKKHHSQAAGHTFYQLHPLFDKHANEHAELIDIIAERIQLRGGITVGMGAR